MIFNKSKFRIVAVSCLKKRRSFRSFMFVLCEIKSGVIVCVILGILFGFKLLSDCLVNVKKIIGRPDF